MRSPYFVLGIRHGASATEIKAAYKRKAKKLHPDHGGDAAKFRELNESYRLLSDPLRRREYDAHRATPRKAPAPAPTPTPNLHPDAPPPTSVEWERIAAMLRAVGIAVSFSVAQDIAPDPHTRNTMRRARRKAESELDSLIESLLGGTQR